MPKKSVLICALFLCGCGSNAPFDERAMWDNSFAEEVLVKAPLFAAGDAGTGDARCISERLFEIGTLKYTPDPSGPPWISVDSPTKGEGYYPAFKGRRYFDSATNQQRYTRDASDYFAETITYYVKGDSPLPMPPRGYGPFTVRDVYVNDPAVGEWKPVGAVPDDVLGTVTKALADQSQCAKSVMQQQAKVAYERAMELSAGSLARNGSIAKTKIPDVLFAKNAHLFFYIGFAKANAFANPLNGMIGAQARAMCSNVRNGLAFWRLATNQDFRSAFISVPSIATMVVGSSPDALAFPDTDDLRLWGDIRPAPGTDTRFLTTDGMWAFEPNRHLELGLGQNGQPEIRFFCVAPG